MPEKCLVEAINNLTQEIATLNSHLAVIAKPIVEKESAEDAKVKFLNRFMFGVEK